MRVKGAQVAIGRVTILWCARQDYLASGGSDSWDCLGNIIARENNWTGGGIDNEETEEDKYVGIHFYGARQEHGV